MSAVAELVALRDGSRALVRPVERSDSGRLREGLRQLSPESRYLRFHMPVDELTDEQVRHLTDVDGRDHIAYVALDPDDPQSPGMGVARCIRLRGEPEVAEAAVTVLDRYQGRGVGTILLDRVSRAAAAHGIRVLRNYVLVDNSAMLEILEALGATKEDDGAGVYRVDLPLRTGAEGTAGPAAQEALRASATDRLRFLGSERRLPSRRRSAVRNDANAPGGASSSPPAASSSSARSTRSCDADEGAHPTVSRAHGQLDPARAPRRSMERRAADKRDMARSSATVLARRVPNSCSRATASVTEATSPAARSTRSSTALPFPG